ncbi:hypothetical protein LSH36_38g04000 [Paralvinella palmiformis]|uniref:Uncharacterized protein n=1 Tax=Paralvinella palmiformis TaxID=53620 RepID=A0AAD9K8B5_9ANNE|nr:hypothetical protein LSH36_38g04000 [Paralvinella palmiformis]
MDDSVSIISNEYDFRSTDGSHSTRGLDHFRAEENNKQSESTSSDYGWKTWKYWRSKKTDIIYIILLVALTKIVLSLTDLITAISNFIIIQKEPDQRYYLDTKYLLLWLIGLLGAIWITTYLFKTWPSIQDQLKPTQPFPVDASTATNDDLREPYFNSDNQQIDAILIDLLERLLTEPVSMCEVKLRRDQTMYIWHTVKDLYLSGKLTSNNKLKVMKLAQNTVEIFVEDKTIMDIVISILHPT